jgi:hypothetical protein
MVLAASVAAFAGPSSAQIVLSNLGDLVCSVGPGTESDDATVGGSHNVICVFAPSEDGPEETYSGTLLTAGVHDDLVGKPVVIWAVRGVESERARAGILAQTFTGSAADADGAKGPLVGDANTSVVLTLMTKSDAAQPGKPATASIELKLTSAAR